MFPLYDYASGICMHVCMFFAIPILCHAVTKDECSLQNGCRQPSVHSFFLRRAGKTPSSAAQAIQHHGACKQWCSLLRKRSTTSLNWRVVRRKDACCLLVAARKQQYSVSMAHPTHVKRVAAFSVLGVIKSN